MKMNKKYSYLFVCMCFVLFLYGCTPQPQPQPKLQFQSTEKRDWKAPSMDNWKNGVVTTADGHVITKEENDRFYAISSYNKDGQKDGLFAKYDRMHHTSTFEKTYRNGALHGMRRMYGIDMPYVNGIKEGTEKEFKIDTSHGNREKKFNYMVRSTPYHKGKRHGVEQIFSYTTGRLVKRITYDMGTKKRIEHYCKKKISLRIEMDGCRHGMERAWHCGTGILSRETPYHTCKQHGIEKVYDKQGNLTYSITYRNGVKEGIAKGYYPNAKTKYEVIYHADKVNEKGYYYDAKGKKERIDYDTIIKFSDRFPVSVEYWRL